MGKNFPIQAERLALQREQRGYTQVELCKIIDRSLKTYRQWEKGETRPDCDVLVMLAELYNVSTDYLLGLTDEKRHGLKFIHEETGLSEAAITVLQYANNKPDFFKKDNLKIASVINMILETDNKAIERLKKGETYLSGNLLTLIYDYVFSDSVRADTDSGDTVTFSADMSLQGQSFDISRLLREVKITEIRETLDGFRATKKQGK